MIDTTEINNCQKTTLKMKNVGIEHLDCAENVKALSQLLKHSFNKKSYNVFQGVISLLPNQGLDVMIQKLTPYNQPKHTYLLKKNNHIEQKSLSFDKFALKIIKNYQKWLTKKWQEQKEMSLNQLTFVGINNVMFTTTSYIDTLIAYLANPINGMQEFYYKSHSNFTLFDTSLNEQIINEFDYFSAKIIAKPQVLNNEIAIKFIITFLKINQTKIKPTSYIFSLLKLITESNNKLSYAIVPQELETITFFFHSY